MYSGKSCCIWVKLVVFGKSGRVQANVVVFSKVVVFKQMLLYWGKNDCIRQKEDVFLKVVVFGISRCIRSKVVVFGEIVFGKSGCIGAKVVVFEQSGCSCEGRSYSGKSGCIREKVFVFLQRGCIRTIVVVFVQKWLLSGKKGCIQTKVVVFVQSGCIRARVVVIEQYGCIPAEWLCWGKSSSFWAKMVKFGKIG